MVFCDMMWDCYFERQEKEGNGVKVIRKIKRKTILQ